MHAQCEIKATVLSVDDSASFRRLVTAALASAGYRAIEAADGATALAAAQSQQVDLVLADYNMPRMNGIELVQALRALPGHRSTPVLLLTTECDEALKASGKAAGASGWLRKPFDPPALLAAIERVIGQAAHG
jgi:two-component system chemotaxis response regulator CheY